VWEVAALRELYCTFAEPDAIGLSSIAGLLCPCPRTVPEGVMMHLADPADAPTIVLAPIAPGLLIEVGVQSWAPLNQDRWVDITTRQGVIALDGEREIEFAGVVPTVRLVGHGPRCVDVAAVLAHAASTGLLVRAGHGAAATATAAAVPTDDRQPVPA
jgi:hypothetical protein